MSDLPCDVEARAVAPSTAMSLSCARFLFRVSRRHVENGRDLVLRYNSDDNRASLSFEMTYEDGASLVAALQAQLAALEAEYLARESAP